jgi:phosphate starvation-inducible PhoH-like protein
MKMHKRIQRREQDEPALIRPERSLILRPPVEPATRGQRRYVRAIQESDITICDGRAGTGKTFLAAGVALHEMVGTAHYDPESRAGSIIICRPAVEAEEKLGFLPGNADRKIAPYLAPVMEAIRLFSKDDDEFKALTDPKVGIVRSIPLAHLRGHTFRDAIVIMDEAQNTTPGQMEMFLTRMGENSRLIIVGDSTQGDLRTPRGEPIPNGLAMVIGSLEGKTFRRGRVTVCRLGLADIMRRGLIAEVLEAIEETRREIAS